MNIYVNIGCMVEHRWVRKGGMSEGALRNLISKFHNCSKSQPLD